MEIFYPKTTVEGNVFLVDRAPVARG